MLIIPSSSNTDNINVNIIIGGWGDFDKHISKLRVEVEKQIGIVHHFRYGQENESILQRRFPDMETLAQRFYQFLQTHKYLEQKEPPLNFIGYSQGGMIGLYAAGLYPEIRAKINKIVTIASPHGGILEKSIRQGIIQGYNFLKPWLNSHFLGKITTSVMDFALESMDLLNFLDHNGIFLEKQYPTSVNQVFHDIPKERIMQIYSPKDYIARPESCGRFQEQMIMHSVENHDHQEIVQNDSVIKDILEFLSQ